MHLGQLHSMSVTAYAKQLRRNATDAERKLWRHVRNRQLDGHRFRRQQPLGPYIVDFVCLDKKLIVEVDGGQHAERVGRDEKRTAWLELQGFRVLRFWNKQVLTEIEEVKQSIMMALEEDIPSPSDGRGLG